MLRKTFTDLTISALASRPISALMQPLRDVCVPVFMLHRIAVPELGIRGHSPAYIDDTLKYLKRNGYQGISVRELIQALKNNLPLPNRAVAFTMDDGFYEQAELALPLFEKHRMPISMFLATDLLDKQFWSWDFKLEYLLLNTTKDRIQLDIAGHPFMLNWAQGQDRRPLLRNIRSHLKHQSVDVAIEAVEYLSRQLNVALPEKAPKPFRTMTWYQARSFESDLIEFGPHTCSHLILSQLSAEQANLEITESWKRLCSELSNPLPVFCYPTGRMNLDFHKRDQELVKAAGFIGALSSDPGYVDLRPSVEQDLYSLNRFGFPDSFQYFQQYSSWIERAKNLVFHR